MSADPPATRCKENKAASSNSLSWQRNPPATVQAVAKGKKHTVTKNPNNNYVAKVACSFIPDVAKAETI